MSRLALRFISGKYQGGEFPLNDEQEIIIGRAQDLPMVLVEDMVSRKHAKIEVFGDEITITDLGSTNGTFVNGEKIARSRLNEGDRVLIGTSIIKVVAAGAHAGGRPPPPPAPGASEDASMSGTLQEVPIPDLIQLFSTSKRTGVLTVEGPAGQGRIYLRSGQLYYALINGRHELGPMKSLCRLVAWREGEFRFGPDPGDEEILLELDDPTESLLIEAMRQLDELNRLRGQLPGEAVPVRLAHPLTPALRDLSPAALDLLQLAHNQGSVAGVLDTALGTDLETAEGLSDLFARGYLASGS